MIKPAYVFYLVPVAMLLIGSCLPATAQQYTSPNTQQSSLRIPAFNTGQFNNGPQVAPVSLTTPARVLNQPSQAFGERQIRVNIRFLSVDDETRDAIYAQLGNENVKTKTQRIPMLDRDTQLSAQVSQGSHLRSSREILSTSCVSTCVLSPEMTHVLIGQVGESVASTVSAAPSIILFDGQDGQMNEMVQRPFVVDVPAKIDPAAEKLPTPKTNPIIQVLDEGTSMRVKTTSRNLDQLHLAADLTYTRILDFHSQRVYGVGPSAASIQVPKHQVESASIAEEMSFGQTLLIDPYVTRETEFKSERSLPILGKIPYINRSFKNVAVAKVKTNLMVLIEPEHAK